MSKTSQWDIHRRCEAQWREDGTLKYYGLDCA